MLKVRIFVCQGFFVFVEVFLFYVFSERHISMATTFVNIYTTQKNRVFQLHMTSMHPGHHKKTGTSIKENCLDTSVHPHGVLFAYCTAAFVYFCVLCICVFCICVFVCFVYLCVYFVYLCSLCICVLFASRVIDKTLNNKKNQP